MIATGRFLLLAILDNNFPTGYALATTAQRGSLFRSRTMRTLHRCRISVMAFVLVSAACSSTTDPEANVTWKTADGAVPAMNFVLTTTGATLGGAGGITVTIPNYSGDSFVITSGTMTSQTIAFAATLGSNPDGNGGTWVGSLSFSGTFADATTITGTLTYTPPRTKTQVFTQQSVASLTLTKRKS